MRADVSVDCLSNNAELIAAGVGHLDVKSCPSSCLSANPPALHPIVITATGGCLRFLEGNSCQHFHCLSLSVKHSISVMAVDSSTLLDWLRFSSRAESFRLLKRHWYLLSESLSIHSILSRQFSV